MSKLATRPRLTADDYLTLAWVRDNMGTLRAMVESWDADARYLAESALPADRKIELVGVDALKPREVSQSATLSREDGDTLLRSASGMTDDELTAALAIPLGDAAPISDAQRCSVCLSVIPDLDLPCPACVEAGRLAATPQAGHGADIAELQRAREQSPLDVPGATPPIERVTSAPVPRVSNAINRAPLPTPPPPARAYSATETCNACGRLGELHMDKGGPIGHVFEPQP